MNIAVEHSSPSVQRHYPVLWHSLPLIFFLATVGVGMLSPSPLTRYVPFIALFQFVLTLGFRTWGLALSYSLLAMVLFLGAPSLSRDVLLWQMGLFFALALNSYILLLSLEEEASLEKPSEPDEVSLLRLKKSYEENVKELNEEIERLKEEAELRRIEKQKALESVQQEIIELKRSLAQVQGTSNQLRSQFNEKATLLSTTREQLFRIETALAVKE
ncbi:MAG: hypothetical protein HY324_02810, partial [Chlamydiia bacterium]|nr:hypothetical protein [Chlamydiia bacterium]